MRYTPFVVAAALALPAAALGGASAPQTERLGVSSTGAQGNHGGNYPVLSGDGRFAVFTSESSNLVPGDTNKTVDVFVRDRQTGKTERVSVSSSGRQANGSSEYGVSISDDGRYVAFASSATNLVAGHDRSGRGPDVFVRDRKLHRTTRVSVTSAGKQGQLGSEQPVISGDGSAVAFMSSAELAPQDRRNSHRDVFVRNLGTHKTDLVSVSLSGKRADSYSKEPSISADGRRIAFTSRATNLVDGSKHRVTDIYVRDLTTHKTTLVSANSSGDGPSRRSFIPSISADGRFVAFTSLAPNLVAGDTNGLDDVFLRDLTNGTTERVSVGSAGNQSVSDHSEYGVVSAHGEYVAFQSGAQDLVVPDSNGFRSDIYLRDVANHTTRRVSVNSAGAQGNDISSVPSISADGRFVGFWSLATNLAGSDTNMSGEPFVRGPLQP